MAANTPVPVTTLNSLMRLLGTTKASLWPFYENEGVTVAGLSSGDLTPAETSGAAEALKDDFNPLLHPGGVHSYHFNPTGDHHLAGIDHADYTHGNGTVDTALSLGAFILPNAIASNAIIAKYDSAGNKEEYRLWINGSGALELEIHDASGSGKEVASGATLALHQGVVAIATYDGDQATPEMHLYVNGVDGNSAGTSTETGTYVAMEDTDAPVLVGAGGVTATPTTEFHGRIALPFVTGKELTQEEVNAVTNIYKELLGLP